MKWDQNSIFYEFSNYLPEHDCWVTMRQRCYNKNHPRYKDWGGRGIKVCDEWIDSFDIFFADMGFRPSNKYSIERLDNDGDYDPDNCIWATSKEQSKNKRKNSKIHLLRIAL